MTLSNILVRIQGEGVYLLINEDNKILVKNNTKLSCRKGFPAMLRHACLKFGVFNFTRRFCKFIPRIGIPLRILPISETKS